MAFYNGVILIGNLTKDPELRSTPSGVHVCDMCVAINRRFVTTGVNQQKQEKDEVCFIDVVVWSKQAESCAKYLRKGASVFVEGRLKNDNWEDRDGKKRTRIRVVAERVQFLNLKYDNDTKNNSTSMNNEEKYNEFNEPNYNSEYNPEENKNEKLDDDES
jgi:single-strand DNA-binding protein